MMKRKEYEKPAMQVFPLRQKPQLLAGSDTVNATMTGTWDEENI